MISETRKHVFFDNFVQSIHLKKKVILPRKMGIQIGLEYVTKILEFFLIFGINFFSMVYQRGQKVPVINSEYAFVLRLYRLRVINVVHKFFFAALVY